MWTGAASPSRSERGDERIRRDASEGSKKHTLRADRRDRNKTRANRQNAHTHSIYATKRSKADAPLRRQLQTGFGMRPTKPMDGESVEFSQNPATNGDRPDGRFRGRCMAWIFYFLFPHSLCPFNRSRTAGWTRQHLGTLTGPH